MATLADLLTQLQDAEAKRPTAPWSGPGEGPRHTTDTPDTMPKWYRDVQPYRVNVPAAIEGIAAATGMPVSAPGALASGAKHIAGSPLAQKLGAAAAALLGLGSPTEANKNEAPAQQSMAPKNQAYLDLLAQQSALQKRLDEARATMETAQAAMEREQRTGRGPKYDKAFADLTAAKAAYGGLDTQMQALLPAIANEQKKTDPKFLLEMQVEEEKAADEKRRRTMNTSVKEMFADVAPWAPMASAGTALVAGKGIKGAYVDKFNTKMGELNSRWGKAVESGNKTLADALQMEAQTLAKKGPGGTWSAIGTGIGIGELGQVLPIAADYAKAIPGSDLYNKTVESMKNPAEVAGRMFTGALLGGVPAKVGASFAARNTASPTGYAAETRAMPSPRDPGPSQPPSSPGSPNTPGPQGSGTLPTSQSGLEGTAANSNTSLADLLKSGAITTQDMMSAMNIKPANKGANPADLPKHLTVDDRLSGSKIRNKETGRAERDPSKKD